MLITEAKWFGDKIRLLKPSSFLPMLDFVGSTSEFRNTIPQCCVDFISWLNDKARVNV